MAEYVKQLLELDEGRQKDALNPLSQHADSKKCGEFMGGGGCGSFPFVGDFAAEQYHQWMTEKLLLDHMSLQQFNGFNGLNGLKAPPAQSLRPRAQAQSTQDAAGSNMKLQQATNVLQAALAYWEACLQCPDSAEALQPPMIPEQFMPKAMPARVPMGLTRQDPFSQRGPLYVPTPEDFGNSMPSSGVVNMIEKALTDLTSSVNPEQLLAAQAILNSTGLQRTGLQAGVPLGHTLGQATGTKDLEMFQLLAQQLEKERETSKLLSGLLQEKQAPLPPGNLAGFPFHGPVGLGQPMANSKSSWPYMGAVAPNRLSAGSVAGWQEAGALVQGLGSAGNGGGLRVPPARTSSLNATIGTAAGRASNAVAMPKAGGKGSYSFQQGAGPKQRRHGPMPDDSGSNNTTSIQSPAHCETLRMHLRSLLKVESNRVLIVRKINRLGFASPQALSDHYSWYGRVERVLVAHSRVKSGNNAGITSTNMPSRLRPSGLGFVVMSTVEEADTILAQGPEQVVCGAVIRVQRFERRMVEDEEEEEQDEGQDEGQCDE